MLVTLYIIIIIIIYGGTIQLSVYRTLSLIVLAYSLLYCGVLSYFTTLLQAGLPNVITRTVITTQ